jgi:hypothetical protein
MHFKHESYVVDTIAVHACTSDTGSESETPQQHVLNSWSVFGVREV